MLKNAKVTPSRRWRRRVDWLGGFLVASSVLTLASRHWWIADVIANLRVQLLIGLLGTSVLCLILSRRKMMLVVLSLTLWQAMALRSAFQPSDTQMHQAGLAVDVATAAQGEQRLRVYLANVLTRNQHHDQIIAQIRAENPDVIAILELSSTLESLLHREFSSTYKYAISESQNDGNFGIGLWSRYPLSDACVFHLNVPILPSIETDIQMPWGMIRVMATHPLPPIGARNFAHRNQHLALLAQRLQKHFQVEASSSQILLGDLNLTPWSPLFGDFLASTGLQNAAAGRGLQPTWYRWPGFPFGLLLDHGLHSGNLHCDQRTILAANGSDHRAIVFDFLPLEPRGVPAPQESAQGGGAVHEMGSAKKSPRASL